MIGFHSASWIRTDLFVHRSWEHLHGKFGIRENDIGVFFFFFFGRRTAILSLCSWECWKYNVCVYVVQKQPPHTVALDKVTWLTAYLDAKFIHPVYLGVKAGLFGDQVHLGERPCSVWAWSMIARVVWTPLCLPTVCIWHQLCDREQYSISEILKGVCCSLGFSLLFLCSSFLSLQNVMRLFLEVSVCCQTLAVWEVVGVLDCAVVSFYLRLLPR